MKKVQLNVSQKNHCINVLNSNKGNKNMKILITGCNGFIGTHLVQELQNNHVVYGVDKQIKHEGDFFQRKIDLVKESYKIEQLLKEVEPDLIIHLAAQSQLRYSIKYPVNDAMTNIIGAINLLEAMYKSNVTRIIYASTGNARYGYNNFCWESEPVHPISPYGISKHTVEHYLDAYQHMYKIWPTTLCFGNVYGPGDDPNLNRIITLLITKALRGEKVTIFGDGMQARDFVYIDDIIQAVQCAIQLKPNRQRRYREHELFNIGTETEITVNTVIKQLCKMLPIKVEYTKSVSGELSSTPIKCDSAKKTLKWKPKWTFERGLETTVQWFKENYK